MSSQDLNNLTDTVEKLNIGTETSTDQGDVKIATRSMARRGKKARARAAAAAQQTSQGEDTTEISTPINIPVTRSMTGSLPSISQPITVSRQPTMGTPTASISVSDNQRLPTSNYIPPHRRNNRHSSKAGDFNRSTLFLLMRVKLSNFSNSTMSEIFY
jgi:hypothetical protein